MTTLTYGMRVDIHRAVRAQICDLISTAVVNCGFKVVDENLAREADAYAQEVRDDLVRSLSGLLAKHP